MTRNVPILDLKQELAEIKDEISAAISSVIESTEFIAGPEVQKFEKEAADYLGVKHAIACNSGTDAILIGLRTLGIKRGDEVITTPFSFFATAEPVSLLEAKPVFVDIQPGSFNIDPELIKKAITPKTKAIIPVHLFGQAAEMDKIMSIAKEHGLVVLEDTAQGFGGGYKNKKIGTIGSIGAYSFFPSKNLGCFGDGGLAVTNDDDLAKEITKLRQHGSVKKYYNEIVGYNSRLDSIQAAVLRVKLKRIDQSNDRRRIAAARYNKMLNNIKGLVTPLELDDCRHIYHQYTVRITGNKRDAVKEKLAAKGISTMVYYPVPINDLPVYNENCDIPHSRLAAKEVLSLPIWPQITEDTQRYVVENLINAL
jgi:dTDP-4-amino-4,6-dideoxygalactose transaminase